MMTGIGEVWLVDLEAGVIEVFRAPRGDQHRERTLLERGEVVQAAGRPDVQLRVEDVLG